MAAVTFPLNTQKVVVDKKAYLRARPDGTVDARILRLYMPTTSGSDGCTACGGNAATPARSARPCACSGGGLNGLGEVNETYSTVWSVISALSAAVSGYHGYKRNDSAEWGAAWFLLGAVFPVVTPTVAFAQGFGERAR